VKIAFGCARHNNFLPFHRLGFHLSSSIGKRFTPTAGFAATPPPLVSSNGGAEKFRRLTMK
jgi:hypothetical protein